MPVGLLLITHQRIGDELLGTVSNLFDPMPLKVKTLSVSLNSDPDTMREDAAQIHTELDDGAGVIIITDMFGSTPSNIASSLLCHPQTQMLAGLSLPMLVRILNYAHLPLNELIEKAKSGGHEGLIHCTKPEDCHA
jgi:PTS system ascorbate-specific IIA component